MWFPLALIVGFALAFLAIYLAERRSIDREAAEREEDAWRAAIGPGDAAGEGMVATRPS